MPRPLRPVLPGQSLHLIQRGVNRSACFVDDEDRRRYTAALRESSERAGCAIHAYVLMTNHVHLLITAESVRSPARMMQMLGRKYVRYFNDRHGRTGTLWEGRYRACLVDSDRYLLACSRYIEMNPVRAGLVNRPSLYRWSSFRNNAEGQSDALVTPHALFAALGRSPQLRRVAYKGLFALPLDRDLLESIPQATNAGSVLGSERYVESCVKALGRPLRLSSRGGDRRSSSFVSSTIGR